MSVVLSYRILWRMRSLILSGTNLTNASDRLNATTWFHHDTFRQRVKITDPRGGSNVVSYCACGSLVESQTDGVGKTTGYGYDLQGRRTSVSIPGAGTITYTRDILGRVVSTMDATGQSATNGFSVQGLVIYSRITWNSGARNAPNSRRISRFSQNDQSLCHSYIPATVCLFFGRNPEGAPPINALTAHRSSNSEGAVHSYLS